MSAEKDWLFMLEKATNYSELQSAFARMIVDSQSTDDGDALVASIDEAIRRIEMERARDQTELDGFSSDYEAFKQEQSGVIGWFKRKLPFTETRKQELGHRDAVNDQAAEILADNMIIARAQMLKERIASPKLRRMGQQPSFWRSQFQRVDSLDSIREYGNVVAELGKEQSVAKLFTDNITIEIDAFFEAKFVNKEDQLRRNDDLTAAKVELKVLVDELAEKANLRIAALATLKNLLVSELSEKDIDFRNTIHRLELVENLQDKQPALAKLLSERLAIAKTVLAKMSELDLLPDRRAKVEQTVKTLKRDGEVAEQKRLRAFNELQEPSQLYNAALQESKQAKVALNASKPLYQAYISEQNRAPQNAAEVTSDSDIEVSTSSVLTEYRRLEEAANQSAQELSQRTSPFEQATRNHDNTDREAKTIREKSEVQVLELKKISDLESTIQQQLLKSRLSFESTLPAFRIAADSFLEDARKITWANTLGASVRSIQELLNDSTSVGFSQSPFSWDQSTTQSATKGIVDMRLDLDRFEKAIQAIEADQKGCHSEVVTLSKARKEALQQRGQMLLDQSVLIEIDLD